MVWLTEKRATRRLLLVTPSVNKILSDTYLFVEGLLFLLLLLLLFCTVTIIIVGGWNNVVGIAICYKSDGAWVNSRWAIFSVLVHNGPKDKFFSRKMDTGFFQGVKRLELRADHPLRYGPRLRVC